MTALGRGRSALGYPSFYAICVISGCQFRSTSIAESESAQEGALDSADDFGPSNTILCICTSSFRDKVLPYSLSTDFYLILPFHPTNP